MGLDPEQFGNLSSIMINPNDITQALYATNTGVQSTRGGFNLAKEMEMEEKKKWI